MKLVPLYGGWGRVRPTVVRVEPDAGGLHVAVRLVRSVTLEWFRDDSGQRDVGKLRLFVFEGLEGSFCFVQNHNRKAETKILTFVSFV